MILKSYIKSLGFLDKVTNLKRVAIREPLLYRADYKYAMKHGGSILHQFIKKIKAGPGWVFDVRVHHLLKDQLPAIDAYHLDFYKKEHSAKVIVAIMGSCSLTKFISEKSKFRNPNGRKRITNFPVGINTYQMKNYEIVEFDTSTFHSATPAVKDGWRIFMRAAKDLVVSNEISSNAFIWDKGNKGQPNLEMWIADKQPHVRRF